MHAILCGLLSVFIIFGLIEYFPKLVAITVASVVGLGVLFLVGFVTLYAWQDHQWQTNKAERSIVESALRDADKYQSWDQQRKLWWAGTAPDPGDETSWNANFNGRVDQIIKFAHVHSLKLRTPEIPRTQLQREIPQVAPPKVESGKTYYAQLGS